MKTFRITVNNELVDYLQRLDFEMAARRNVINALFDIHKTDPDASVLDSAPFKKYHKELVEATAEWEFAKKQVPEKCMPKWLNEHEYNWTLDTITKEFQIDILCDCDIPELADYEVTEA